MITQLCDLYKAYTGRQAWKVIGDRVLKSCYLRRMIMVGKLGVGNKEQMLVNISL
jgi:hypothetical protein